MSIQICYRLSDDVLTKIFSDIISKFGVKEFTVKFNIDYKNNLPNQSSLTPNPYSEGYYDAIENEENKIHLSDLSKTLNFPIP